jgi:hypothetical protein
MLLLMLDAELLKAYLTCKCKPPSVKLEADKLQFVMTFALLIVNGREFPITMLLLLSIILFVAPDLKKTWLFES